MAADQPTDSLASAGGSATRPGPAGNPRAEGLTAASHPTPQLLQYHLLGSSGDLEVECEVAGVRFSGVLQRLPGHEGYGAGLRESTSLCPDPAAVARRATSFIDDCPNGPVDCPIRTPLVRTEGAHVRSTRASPAGEPHPSSRGNDGKHSAQSLPGIARPPVPRHHRRAGGPNSGRVLPGNSHPRQAGPATSASQQSAPRPGNESCGTSRRLLEKDEKEEMVGPSIVISRVRAKKGKVSVSI